MTTLHGIVICSACGEHEAQHTSKCRWCYDKEFHRKKNSTQKVAIIDEKEMLALVEEVVGKIPARSFKKGLK